MSSGDNEIAHLPKPERRRIMVSGTTSSKTAAVIEIQRIWRGHCMRHKLCTSTKFKNASIEPSQLSILSGCSDSSNSGNYCGKIKRSYRQQLELCSADGSSLLPQPTFQDYCAKTIQDWWRRNRRKLVEKKGSWFSSSHMHSSSKKIYTEQTAAIVIQRCWRRYNDIQVYRFYRDLISFQGLGEPSMMLRCINPREAKLLDSGSGVRVKFRLGGVQFPPSVYYKVFTYRSIVDLGAYSPRDYTDMSWRQPLSHDLHNKTKRAAISTSTDGWYKRWENNGWRLVSDRLLLFQPDSDDITLSTAAKKTKMFHPSKFKRKQDVMVARKRKKIAWMKQLYTNGMMNVKEGLSDEATEAIHKATEQIITLSDQNKADSVEDRDIDALLSWTDGLNFDHYISEWSAMGTTNTSDSHQIIFSATEDPYELRLVETGR